MDMRITVLCFVTTFLLQVVSIYSSFPTSRGMPMVAEHFFQSDGSMERAHPKVPKCTMEQGEIMEASRGRKVKKHRNKMKARGGIDVQRTVKLNRSQKFGEPQIPEQHMGTAFRSGPGKSSKAQFMSPAVFNDSDKIGDPSVLYYCVLKISPDPEDVKLIENQSAGETALLHQIAFEGCEQMTEHVLWLSPDNMDDPDEDGMTPIHLAALGGSRGVMALLHGHGADLQALDNVGNTALHHSVFSKDPKSLIWLLMIGLDVNAQNFKKETPLHLAVGHSEFSMVKHLLDNGALLNITNHKGKTPVDLANDSENLQISKLDESGNYKLVLLAVMDGCVSALIHMMGYIRAESINSADDDGMTAVHIAAMMGDVKVLQVLLEGKANILTTDSRHNTALHLAATSGNVDTVWWFLQRGLDADAQNVDRDTAVHLAVKAGNSEVTKTMLYYGAMTNITNKEGKLPLDIALERNDVRLVKLLKSMGSKSSAY